MPFTLEDLDRLKVRVGMSDKTLRELSDTQFGAWLRSLGARGTIGYSESSPGRLVVALEERVRILDELEADGFYVPGIMGSPDATPAAGPDPAVLAALEESLGRAAAEVDIARGLAQQVGEVDPRVSLRQSLDGALALLDAARGAVDRARRAL